MIEKKYVSLTGIQYTFPVKVGQKTVWVSFKGTENSYLTSNEELQGAIEKHPKFLSKEIGLSLKQSSTSEDQPSQWEQKTFPDVTDINGAVEVLKADPYKVHHMKLRTADSVKEQALICNTLFPHLTWPEN